MHGVRFGNYDMPRTGSLQRIGDGRYVASRREATDFASMNETLLGYDQSSATSTNYSLTP